MDDFVHLAIGRGGRIDSAAGIHYQRLHLQFLRSENDAGFAVRSQLVNARRRSRGGVSISLRIGGEAPQIR